MCRKTTHKHKGDNLFRIRVCQWAPNEHYWLQASAAEGKSDEEAIRTCDLHGPFNSYEEAAWDAEMQLLGPKCKVTRGGMWGYSWSKPH